MLSDLTSPLTLTQARHLLRRACFNADPDRVTALVGRSVREVVEEWASEPVTTSMVPGPYWIDRLYPPLSATTREVESFHSDNEYYIREVRMSWLNDLLLGTLGARMTLFWHNHFVTDVNKYRWGALAYRYVLRLSQGALGNFKEMTLGFVTDGAMLSYLDGDLNRRSAPNENFARELLELFTMGPTDSSGYPNYTQFDIEQAARALTGWGVYARESWDAQIAYYYFDPGEKTIFGQTGTFNHEDVIDLIFSQRSSQVASFLAKKLVEEFLYADPPEDFVDAVAERIAAHDFVIGPVLADILSSEAFFDEQYQGARITSPLEFILLNISALKGRPPDYLPHREEILHQADSFGQIMLSPPNVAGWPGHRAWLATDTLPSRWNRTSPVPELAWGVDFAALAEHYVEPDSSHPALSIALRLAEALFAVPIRFVEVPEIEQPFEGNLVQYPLPSGFLEGPSNEINLVKLFLDGIPWYEWDPSANGQMVHNYIQKLSKFPEFQLT